MEKIKKTPIARSLYLVVRGPKSEHHNAPYHPVIVCTRKHTVHWEARSTEKGDTVFECLADGGNWMLCRYKGYDIQSSGYFELFDGKSSRDVASMEEIKKYLNGATWWSYDRIPAWLEGYGIKFPEDNFTKIRIVEDSGDCLLPHAQAEKLRDRIAECEEPTWLIPVESDNDH